MTSTERLNVNLSTAFIELALETLNSLSRESEHVLLKARGSRAPYRIRNLTGTKLRLSSGAETNATIVNDGETIDWRFDDWRTMREVCPHTVHRELMLIQISSTLHLVIAVLPSTLLIKRGRG